jgi:hypothetical protein
LFVSKKSEATFVVPDDSTEMSMSALKLCELFASTVLGSTDSVIDVNVDGKSLADSSGSQPIKEHISMYLKSGKLASFD